MDMPNMPPVVETSSVQSETAKYGDPEELYRRCYLSRIDAEDTPPYVKKYANDHNCYYLIKIYYWSNKKYKGGDVYTCSKNKKAQFVLAKGDELRFANWWERRKLNIVIYEF